MPEPTKSLKTEVILTKRLGKKKRSPEESVWVSSTLLKDIILELDSLGYGQEYSIQAINS